MAAGDRTLQERTMVPRQAMPCTSAFQQTEQIGVCFPSCRKGSTQPMNHNLFRVKLGHKKVLEGACENNIHGPGGVTGTTLGFMLLKLR